MFYPTEFDPAWLDEGAPMQNTSILKIALLILGGALLLCLGGIIFLASANPARPIPDVLVATTGLVSGGLVGILVPSKGPAT